MFICAASGTVIGIDAHEVMVEAHRDRGLPQLVLIGMARGAVKESTTRVRAALSACGAPHLQAKVIVNLLPAELPKEAAALDLALAAALLVVFGMVPAEALAGCRFYGELSLGGGVQPVTGAILLADLSRRRGDTTLLLPKANACQAALIPGTNVVGIDHLGELIAYLRGETVLAAASPPSPAALPVAPRACLSDVAGQAQAKLALLVAAAGNHNMLMTGPPGSGKTMLASRLPDLLPPLSIDEAIETTRILAAAGSSIPHHLLQQRPFRAPHHTISEVALCGGGSKIRPGEITMAHRGVLFLDEISEFSKRALESLREPLELGEITIVRSQMRICFPCQVLLIAACNPCPCGYYGFSGQAGRHCLCPLDTIGRYQARLSGPFLDRIDLHVRVEALSFSELLHTTKGPTSIELREQVGRARSMQAKRLGAGRSNSHMTSQELAQIVPLRNETISLVEQAMQKHGLSSRAVSRVLKVARTLADLNECHQVEPSHVAQAIALRTAQLH